MPKDSAPPFPYPYGHPRYPKDPEGNGSLRKLVHIWAERSELNRKKVLDFCRQDTLWFVNTFCWVFEPRGASGKVLPFLTWPIQDEVFQKLEYAIDHSRDFVAEKSRDMGMTWIFLTMFFKRWLLHSNESYGLISRNADLVDRTDKTDTLFWKISFLLSNLPLWMQPEYHRIRMQLTNRTNGSTIEGEATTANTFRGGRKTAIAADELAFFEDGDDVRAQRAIQHATRTGVYVSTPNGAAGAFYEIAHQISNVVKVVIDWKDHPSRRQGLYEIRNNQIQDLNPSNPLTDAQRKAMPEIHEMLQRRGYALDGTIRSPWYNNECLRPGASPRSIAQELDRDYVGSAFPYFPAYLREQLMAECVREPIVRGMISAEANSGFHFSKNPHGNLLLWTVLDERNMPPSDRRYAMGCDIAAGTAGSHSSNSAATVIDCLTKEQVASLVTNNMPPSKFAETCIAIAKMFHGAYVNFERNGLGQAFFRRMDELGYKNIYYQDQSHLSYKKKTEKPGWWSTDDLRLSALSALSAVMEMGELTPRDHDFVAELGEYRFHNGKVVHSRSLVTDDESSRGAAHGDRVISMAVAWMAVADRPQGKVASKRQNAPYGSMLQRMEEYERSLAVLEDPWDTDVVSEIEEKIW